jgi:hypothetical protein
MRGAAVHEFEVDVGRSGLGEGAKEVFEQLGLEVAYFRGGNLPVADAENAAGKIEGGSGEAIVHRHEEIAGAQNAAFGAEGLLDGFAQSYADVFDGVVLIDVKIALCAEFEVETAVASDLFEHVVEEADAR